MDKLDVKIADFGFSCIYDPEEGLDLVLGSPLYMAPEIIQNKVYNEKVDIWSIGVITYMLLSGSNPFPGQTKEKVKEMIVNSRELIERNLAGKRFQHVSANAKDFITKCLTKDAALRWSAEQLLSHKWMVEKMAETHEDIPEDVQKDIMNNLSQFSNATKF
jgi:serine/threonine protein kinase